MHRKWRDGFYAREVINGLFRDFRILDSVTFWTPSLSHVRERTCYWWSIAHSIIWFFCQVDACVDSTRYFQSGILDTLSFVVDMHSCRRKFFKWVSRTSKDCVSFSLLCRVSNSVQYNFSLFFSVFPDYSDWYLAASISVYRHTSRVLDEYGSV